MKRMISAVVCYVLALACTYARDTPILNGRLESDLNANGKTINGLAYPTNGTDAASVDFVEQYVEEHGGGGSLPGNGLMLTNGVVKTADGSNTVMAADVGAVASYGGTANSLTIGGDSLTANTGINLSEGCSISFAGLTLWSRDSHGSLMLPFLQDEDDTLVRSSDLSRLVDKTEFYEAILGVAKSATNYTDSVASGKLSVHNPAAIVLDAPDPATNKFIVKDGSNSQLFHLGRAGEFELGSYGARITTGSGYEKAYYLTGGATASDNREIAVKGDIPAVPTNIVTYSGTAPQTSAAILSSANAYTDNAISQIPAPSVQSNYLYSANGTYRVNATGELFAASAIVGGYWTDGNGNTFYKVGWDSARTVYEWRSSSLNVPIYYYRNSNPSPMVMYASLFSVACDSRTLDPEVDGTVFPDLVGSGKNCIYHSQQTTFLPDGKPYDRFATTNELAHAVSQPQSPITETAIKWRSDGSAIVVSVAASGTLGVDLTGWTIGQTQTALITLAAGASVSDDIILVGYNGWITGSPFIAECVRVGNKVYVNPVCAVQ